MCSEIVQSLDCTLFEEWTVEEWTGTELDDETNLEFFYEFIVGSRGRMEAFMEQEGTEKRNNVMRLSPRLRESIAQLEESLNPQGASPAEFHVSVVGYTNETGKVIR